MNKFLAIAINRASFEKRDALAFKQKKEKASYQYGIMLNSYLNVANRIITTINVAISPVIPASRASKIMRDSMGLTSFPIWIGRVTHVSLFFYYLGKNTPTEIFFFSRG